MVESGYGKFAPFAPNPLLSKSNGKNGESKMLFISFENENFFQNFILFGLM